MLTHLSLFLPLVPSLYAVLARGYNHSVDWWTLGVLIYVLLTARQPFSSPKTHDPMEVSAAAQGLAAEYLYVTVLAGPTQRHPSAQTCISG
jgi:serine/threonine protein kinase